MSALRIAVLAAALPFALCAMDDEGSSVDHHLRLSGHLLPDAYSASADGDRATGEFDGFTRLRLGYLASIAFNSEAAFLIGVHGVQSTLEPDNDDEDGDEIDQLGGGVEIGVAATPVRNLAFEFTAHGGMGTAEGDDDLDGHYGEFGLTFRPVVRVTMVEFFAELGYFWQKQKLEDSGIDIDIRITGAQFALGAGLVF